MMQKQILTVSILLFFFQFAFTQNKCEFDSISPPVELGNTCQLGFPICISKLDGFSNTLDTLKNTFEQSITSCGDFSRVDWYLFNYCGDSLKIGIKVNSCEAGLDSTGLFAGLASGCADEDVIICKGTTIDEDEIFLEYTGDNLGAMRLFVDGYSSSICEYTITVYQGIGTENPEPVTINCTESVVGDSESCQGGVIQYTTDLECEDPIGGDGYDSTLLCQLSNLQDYMYGEYQSDICYQWTITPETGWEIIGDHNGPTINIKWYNPDSLNAVNPDTFLVERRILHNPYFDDRFGMFCESNVSMNTNFKPLEVIVNPPKVNQYSIEICEGESYEFYGEILTQSGQYSWLDVEACLLEVLDLFVKPAGQDEVIESFTVCPGSCVTYQGVDYCEEGSFNINTDQCQNTQSIEIINGTINIDLHVSDMINCKNTTSVITSIVSTDIDHSSLNYIWFFGTDIVAEGTESIVVSEGGEYTLAVSLLDQQGNELCSSLQSIFVDENFEKLTIQLQDKYDWYCNTDNLNLSASFDESAVGKFTWTTSGGSINQTIDASSVVVDAPGTYYLELVHKISGCSTLDSIEVQEVEGILDVEFQTTDLSCESSEGEVVINKIVGGKEPYIYYVNNQPAQMNTKFDQAGTYTYKVEDSNGCVFEFDFDIHEKGKIEGEVEGNEVVIVGESVDLVANFTSSNDSLLTYSWYLEDGSLISTEELLSMPVLEDQVLTLIVEGNNQCMVTSKVVLQTRQAEFKVFFPNVFTPNDDGVNDYFTIYADKYTKGDLELSVFDRWGSMVYNIKSPFGHTISPKWDGRNGKGQMVLSGTYVYVVKFHLQDKVINRSGTVSVLR